MNVKPEDWITTMLYHVPCDQYADLLGTKHVEYHEYH